MWSETRETGRGVHQGATWGPPYVAFVVWALVWEKEDTYTGARAVWGLTRPTPGMKRNQTMGDGDGPRYIDGTDDSHLPETKSEARGACRPGGRRALCGGRWMQYTYHLTKKTFTSEKSSTGCNLHRGS